MIIISVKVIGRLENLKDRLVNFIHKGAFKIHDGFMFIKRQQQEERQKAIYKLTRKQHNLYAKEQAEIAKLNMAYRVKRGYIKRDYQKRIDKATAKTAKLVAEVSQW